MLHRVTLEKHVPHSAARYPRRRDASPCRQMGTLTLTHASGAESLQFLPLQNDEYAHLRYVKFARRNNKGWTVAMHMAGSAGSGSYWDRFAEVSDADAVKEWDRALLTEPWKPAASENVPSASSPNTYFPSQTAPMRRCTIL